VKHEIVYRLGNAAYIQLPLRVNYHKQKTQVYRAISQNREKDLGKLNPGYSADYCHFGARKNEIGNSLFVRVYKILLKRLCFQNPIFAA
jgi:hypothetical protein